MRATEGLNNKMQGLSPAFDVEVQKKGGMSCSQLTRRSWIVIIAAF